MEEILFMNERFKPSIAVPMSVTVTMPMTMPSVVSTERSLFARMALHEMIKPSRSSVRKFIVKNETGTSNIQHPTSNIQHRMTPSRVARTLGVGCWMLDVSKFLSPFGNFFIARDQSVADADDALRVQGHFLLVRDDDDGVAPVGKALEQRHDFRAGLGIEISRRLVREQDGRLVDERAGDGDALALSAGKFVRLVMHAVGQADAGQRFKRELPPFLRRNACVNQRQFH